MEYIKGIEVILASANLVVVVFAGLIWFVKQGNVITATVGYPAYVGLLAGEVIMRKYAGRDVYILNKPNSPHKLFFDNLIACFTSIFSALGLYSLINVPLLNNQIDVGHVNFLIHLGSGSIGFILFIILCLRHQRYEKDKRDIFDKTQRLSVKQFWRITNS